jgi:ketosteroid isomerase-like protein
MSKIIIGAIAFVAGCAAAGTEARAPSRPREETTVTDESTAERILAEMDAAFARKDLEALLGLFTDDATLESFLVGRILKRKESVCHGKAELREVLRALVERGVPWGSHEPPLVRGDRVAVEFKTRTSERDTFSVDILEISGGKIKSLRAYAGWRAMPADDSAPK